MREKYIESLNIPYDQTEKFNDAIDSTVQSVVVTLRDHLKTHFENAVTNAKPEDSKLIKEFYQKQVSYFSSVEFNNENTKFIKDAFIEIRAKLSEKL